MYEKGYHRRFVIVYSTKDTATLKQLVEKDISAIITELQNYISAFRRQWYHENKTFGFITQEIRLGGLTERMRSVQLRLNAFLNGEIDQIEELEFPALPMRPRYERKYISFNKWRQTLNAGIL